MSHFCHLHTHTSYSLLDGAANIQALIEKTEELGMSALAITDHGNLFGVPHFVTAAKQKGIKPIIGCEFYVAPNMHDHKDKRRYHQVLLAKNPTGYQNLVKLTSLGFTEGYYYKPRVDKACIQKHAQGLIATTCCLGAEIPRLILEQGEAAAERAFLEWYEIFGDDYYIELQRHGIPEQEICNPILLKWAKKYNVKLIATNDVHYIEQKDSLAHDILLCLQTGKDYHDPKRMRFANDQFFLKSPQQMQALFKDCPHAIENTLEVAEKVEAFSLERDVLLPIFTIPPNFHSQEQYLEHLTYQGAKKRYKTLSTTLEERLRYELKVISSMKFAGYFLIVQDIIAAAKKLDVVVGPGRGSGAGSVVAYCLEITEIDPLHYNLLFERFLNPERVSMPDFDIDFDDEGRQRVINYVVEKYGYNQVAHIITFGSMGAKSAIRDVARVLALPLSTANELAKLVPDRLGTTLQDAFTEVPELAALHKKPDTPEGRVLAIANSLEGSPRHSGIHAAGIIIAPDKLINHIPIKQDKNSNLLVTQYDGSVVESVGMLKMDLLGLKTLSILKDAVKLIQQTHQETIDLSTLPLDDEKTYQLFQKGNTIGIFQFESEPMRQWLTALCPTKFEHLIAMNALYRPGPMDNIPTYVARHHGKEQVKYLHPLLEDILAPTYGIPIFQEQIMQIAQKIAGYTLGQADLLRRAMGKKKADIMEGQKATFLKGAQETNNLDPKVALEIFETIPKFAQYAFPRPHSVAYTHLAYWTAYLKAHHPAAFMAATLTHHQTNLSKVSFFIEECKRMGLQVKGPDINESNVHFTNVSPTTIRFGLAAIKGTSKQAMEFIVQHREKHGPYRNLHDLLDAFLLHSPDKLPNKKTLETLALAGAFDNLAPYHRKQYIATQENGLNYLEKTLHHQKKVHKAQNGAQQSLFSEPEAHYGAPPQPEECSPYTQLEKLTLEKELVGFYFSGHPLDPYKLELRYLCQANTQDLHTHRSKTVALAGMITEATHRQNKQGQPFAYCTLEDRKGTFEFTLYGTTYTKYQHHLHTGALLYLQGTVQERPRQKEHWTYHVKTIEPLDTLRQHHFHGLLLKLPVEQLTLPLLNSLEALVQQHPGPHPLYCSLYENGKQTLPLFSQTYKVALTNPLLRQLERLPIAYQPRRKS